MGIALDGHVIVGPYNEDGELYACDDVDVCNGTYLTNNAYAYVMTQKFPYIIGCWGRGSPITTPVGNDCAVNICVQGAYNKLTLLASGFAVAAFALFV